MGHCDPVLHLLLPEVPGAESGALHAICLSQAWVWSRRGLLQSRQHRTQSQQQQHHISHAGCQGDRSLRSCPRGRDQTMPPSRSGMACQARQTRRLGTHWRTTGMPIRRTSTHLRSMRIQLEGQDMPWWRMISWMRIPWTPTPPAGPEASSIRTSWTPSWAAHTPLLQVAPAVPLPPTPCSGLGHLLTLLLLGGRQSRPYHRGLVTSCLQRHKNAGQHGAWCAWGKSEGVGHPWQANKVMR